MRGTSRPGKGLVEGHELGLSDEMAGPGSGRYLEFVVRRRPSTASIADTRVPDQPECSNANDKYLRRSIA